MKVSVSAVLAVAASIIGNALPTDAFQLPGTGGRQSRQQWRQHRPCSTTTTTTTTLHRTPTQLWIAVQPQMLYATEADSIFDSIVDNLDDGTVGISHQDLRTHLQDRGYSPLSVRLLFTALDKNADGIISREEMHFAFENYEIVNLYRAFGLGIGDDDDQHNERDTRAAIESIRKNAIDGNNGAGSSSSSRSPELLTKLADLIFDMIDTDRNGEIDVDELRFHFRDGGSTGSTAVREIGHASSISTDSILKALDLNADGVISRDEMRKGFNQYDPAALAKALGLPVLIA